MNVQLRETTSAATGGVSVLALHGPGSLLLVEQLVGRSLAIGQPAFARLRRGADCLDEIVVAPLASDDVELHTHASVPLVRELRLWLRERHGVQVESEPTLARAPSFAELVRDAPCESAARTWLDQAEGALARALRELCEVEPTRREERLDRLLENGRRARFLSRPARVLLAGPVNAGKSTLFNVLLGRPRAITSDREGTTRDVLREPALLGDWPVELWDGAGERTLPADPADGVERAGQLLARAATRAADLVFWLVPVGQAVDAPASPAVVVVRTHADRDPGQARAAVSALFDPHAAREQIRELFCEHFALPERAWQQGAPVPADADLLELLRELRLDGADSRLLRRLEAWMD